MYHILHNAEAIKKRLMNNSPDKYKMVGFTKLPHYLLYDERLDRVDLMVYWAIASFIFNESPCGYPSLQKIEKLSRYSRNMVIESTKKLERLKYIRVNRKKDKEKKSNMYYLVEKDFFASSGVDNS